MTKSIEIEIEVERNFIVQRNRIDGVPVVFCPRCGRGSKVVSIDEAALLSRSNSRSIFNRAINGDLHSIETEEGLVVICGNFLGESLHGTNVSE